MQPMIKCIDQDSIDLMFKLEDKIEKVCSKIEYPYDFIEWIIFNPYKTTIDGKKINILEMIDISRTGRIYGCTDGKSKIWISTIAINKGKANLSERDQKLEDDFLANVILDEITHIVTGCNHGDKKYDRKLKIFKSKYYEN